MNPDASEKAVDSGFGPAPREDYSVNKRSGVCCFTNDLAYTFNPSSDHC